MKLFKLFKNLVQDKLDLFVLGLLCGNMAINVPIVGFKAPIPDPLAATNSPTSTIAPFPVLSPISIGIGTINGSNILLQTPTPFF